MADPVGKYVRTIARLPGALLARTGVTPDQVTIIGLAANFVAAFFIARQSVSYQTAALLIWAAGFFDALDGSVARASGRVTMFGNFFDSVIDRYSDCAIYFGIMARFLLSENPGYALLAALALIGSFAVSYVRAKAESLGLKCEVGLMPRSARIILLGAAFLVSQPFWGLVIVAALSHLTVLQRVVYVHKTISKTS
jgi:CDP-diacylglycerol--glycerol-3-phosphate 3-phosphatidyltransferase